MKTKLMTAVLAVAAATVSAPAFAAESGVYLRGDIGLSDNASFRGDVLNTSFDQDLDDGLTYGVGIGYNLGNGFRLEAVTQVTNNDVSVFSVSAEGRSMSVMGNVMYDLPSFKKFTPYVGAGAGYGRAEVETVPFLKAEGDGLAWQALVGVSYAVNDRLSLETGYRHYELRNVDLEDPNLNITFSGEYKTDAFTAGMRIKL